MSTENGEGRPRARTDLPNDQPGGEVSDRVTAFAEIHLPSSRRRLPAAVYGCPLCGGTHFARSRSLEGLTGVRRSGCGRLVWVVAVRYYGGAQ